MGLNDKGILSSEISGTGQNDDSDDTALGLNCFGNIRRNMKRCESTRFSHGIAHSNASEDGCRLVLGLGPAPATHSDEHHHICLGKGSSAFHPGKLSVSESVLELTLSKEMVEDIGMQECTASEVGHINLPLNEDELSADDKRLPAVDEGSTSARMSGGYMQSLPFGPTAVRDSISLPCAEHVVVGTKSYCLDCKWSPETYATKNWSRTISMPVAAASSDRRINSKTCKFPGCPKGARGASGLCIGHGGGQRCQKLGCSKGAESRTVYCKAHGGGRRCERLGCTKSAEGKTDYCIAHGGGKRCGYPGGCTKAARGKSGLCIRHGGGKRCKIEGCTRSAEGQAGLCISHGGGRRCQYEGCTKGAQGSTMFCKAHGGGKRCIFAGCTKGAEGSTPLCKGHGGGKRCLYHGGGICPKSVHGGTNFCVAHGGGKRCAVPGCTKSARGRTDCCVRHGGGKRCGFENCGKSAQGSTDLCKAHGGGKRCSWVEKEVKCQKFARGRSRLCAAHLTTSMFHEQQQEGLINRQHSTEPKTFPSTAGNSSSSSYDNSSAAVSVLLSTTSTTNSLENPTTLHQYHHHHLIPPQVLVPVAMKCPKYGLGLPLGAEKQIGGNQGSDIVVVENGRSLRFVLPEGRVHGGGLMTLFGGSLNNAIDVDS